MEIIYRGGNMNNSVEILNKIVSNIEKVIVGKRKLSS